VNASERKETNTHKVQNKVIYNIWVMIIIMMIMIITILIIIIQFYIYLCAEQNSQWPLTESARIQITATSQHRIKQRRSNRRNKKKKTKKNESVKALNNQTRVSKSFCKFKNCICG
jgi:hypothetical protein